MKNSKQHKERSTKLLSKLLVQEGKEWLNKHYEGENGPVSTPELPLYWRLASKKEIIGIF
jgi:hypothetical protein